MRCASFWPAGLLSLTAFLICAPTGAQDGASAIASASSSASPSGASLAVDLEGELVPDIGRLTERRDSEMRDAVLRFTNDRRALMRRYDAIGSSERSVRLTAFYSGWLEALADVDFDGLDREGRVDWILLRDLIGYELYELERQDALRAETAPLLPFADAVLALQDQRRRREGVDPREVAGQLEALAKQIEETEKGITKGLEAKKRREKAAEASQKGQTEDEAEKDEESEESSAEDDEVEPIEATRIVAHRAAGWTEGQRKLLESWYAYHAGYDPLFTWWVKDPYEKLDEVLENYVKFLRESVLEIKEDDDPPIIGDPIGRESLIAYLDRALIAYTPEELIEIGEAELEWCLSEMRRAAQEMGFGDDWRAALEKVKTLHVEPGDQPRLVRDLAYEATEFMEESDMITIPPLAKEVWRIEMMTPEEQKMNPFFLGGEVIKVSFPTDEMSHEEKQMSLRGNNIHFSRATVHHELIPGHHLQGFMTSRYQPHRRTFNTPFWGEGWALYWELRLYEMGFPASPEDRVGMLFWRMHRCARVIWSLKFHLGEMTGEEAVEFLVDEIGHERENAAAEVRRSIEGRYSPIYQLAYLMGGLQFRALNRELVGSGAMTEREFHDAVLQGGPMPIEMVRARISGLPLEQDSSASWRYMD